MKEDYTCFCLGHGIDAEMGLRKRRPDPIASPPSMVVSYWVKTLKTQTYGTRGVLTVDLAYLRSRKRSAR
jgi:uncharacterized membrane protein